MSSNSSNTTTISCSSLSYLKTLVGNNDSLCSVISSIDSCSFDEGFIQYKYFVFCFAGGEVFSLILITLWLFVLLLMLGVTADGFFSPCLISISNTLRLSQSLAGVTLLALGNGAPDIFSALSSVNGMDDNDAGLSFGALLGAGLFVNCITGGSVMIVKPFLCARRPLMKDLIFYTIAVLWVLAIFIKGNITLWDSLGFIVLYIIYATMTLTARAIYSTQKRRKILDNNPPLEEEEPPLEEEEPVNYLPKPHEENKRISTGSDFHGYIRHNANLARWTMLHGEEEEEQLAVDNEINNYRFSPNNELNETPSYFPPMPTQTGGINVESQDLSPILTPTTTSETDYEFPGLWKDFLYQIIPLDLDEWGRMKKASRVLEIIRSPLIFILRLTVPLVDDDRPLKAWSKILYCLLCFTTPCFFIFIIKGGKLALLEIGNSHFPVYGLVLLISVIPCLAIWFTSKSDKPPIYHNAFAFIGFATSIVWIYSAANEVVNILETLGLALNVSHALLGLTLLAWANSIGDMISNLVLAKKNYPRIAYSACVGGPLFNVLWGIGLPFTIKCFSDGKIIPIKANSVQYLLVGFLLLMLLVKFTIIPFVCKFQLKKHLGFVMISIYAIFMPIAIVCELVVNKKE